MLIKTDNSQSLWIHCGVCNTAFHPGGRCKCGNISTSTGKDGITRIVADDSDTVTYDNE